MSKLIALRSGFNDAYFNAWRSDFSSRLKQQTLLFDQIGILNLDQMYKIIRTYETYPHSIPSISEIVLSELEYLEQNEMIFNLTLHKELSTQSAKNFFKSSSSKSDKEINKLLAGIMKRQKIETKNLEDMANAFDSVKERDALILRLLSLVMETTKSASVVTVLSHTEYTRKLPNSSKSNVAQIVISKLPLPNKETPWEQLIDYRNDPENQKNLLNLRRWIRKISTENLSLAEMEDELEWLMNEFHDHMKVHKMKANTETLEVMAKVLPGTIENLIKLNFSKLPEPFFALRKREINLTEAELNAPGREMAYIITTQEAFQPQE